MQEAVASINEVEALEEHLGVVPGELIDDEIQRTARATHAFREGSRLSLAVRIVQAWTEVQTEKKTDRK